MWYNIGSEIFSDDRRKPLRANLQSFDRFAPDTLYRLSRGLIYPIGRIPVCQYYFGGIMSKTHGFCQGDGLRFNLDHQHHALGYCFKEYRKARYRAKHPRLLKMPRICKGDGLPFDQNHKYYALNRCRYAYQRYKRGLSEGPYYCVKCPKYWPGEPPQRVQIRYGVCAKCSPMVSRAIENTKQSNKKQINKELDMSKITTKFCPCCAKEKVREEFPKPGNVALHQEQFCKLCLTHTVECAKCGKWWPQDCCLPYENYHHICKDCEKSS